MKKGRDHHHEIFDYYLSLGLIKHRALTPEMRNAINVARRRGGYTWDDLKLLLSRHAQIVKLTAGDREFAVRPRGIGEFFGQKVSNGTCLICSEYADDGAKWLRYKDGKPQQRAVPQRDNLNIGAKPNYYARPIENYDHLAVDLFAEDFGE